MTRRAMAATAADRVIIRETEPRFVRPFAIAFDPASLSPVGQAFVELIRAQIDPPTE